MNLLNIHDSFPYLHLLMNNKVLLSSRKCKNQIENAKSVIKIFI